MARTHPLSLCGGWSRPQLHQRMAANGTNGRASSLSPGRRVPGRCGPPRPSDAGMAVHPVMPVGRGLWRCELLMPAGAAGRECTTPRPGHFEGSISAESSNLWRTTRPVIDSATTSVAEVCCFSRSDGTRAYLDQPNRLTERLAGLDGDLPPCIVQTCLDSVHPSPALIG